MPAISVTLGVCSLIFCTELGQSMLTPLLPGIANDFGLGPAETGVLVSAATFATLASAVPAGLLAQRIGALRVSLAAGALIAVAAALQALAASFPCFLAGRMVFGVGFAAIWTAGVTLVSAADAPRAAIGATIAAGGAAHLTGPPLSGVLGELVGRSLPFWLLAAGTASVTLLVAGVRTGTVNAAPAGGFRAAAGAARSDATLRGAIVLIALVGVLTGLVPLVAPLLLDRAGFSSSGIGAVFALSSVVWIAASLLPARSGARAMTMGGAAAGLALLAVASSMPVLTLAAPCIVGFLMLRAAVQAPLNTMSYDLAARGARSSDVASATAIGFLNVVWAGAATVSPLLAGVMLSGAGPRWVFVLLASLCAITALAMRRAATAGDARPLPAPA